MAFSEISFLERVMWKWEIRTFGNWEFFSPDFPPSTVKARRFLKAPRSLELIYPGLIKLPQTMTSHTSRNPCIFIISSLQNLLLSNSHSKFFIFIYFLVVSNLIFMRNKEIQWKTKISARFLFQLERSI